MMKIKVCNIFLLAGLLIIGTLPPRPAEAEPASLTATCAVVKTDNIKNWRLRRDMRNYLPNYFGLELCGDNGEI